MTNIIIGTGGSVTNDGGAGMARWALWGRNMPPAMKLVLAAVASNIRNDIDISALIRWVIASFRRFADVTNPLVGDNASRIFGHKRSQRSDDCFELSYQPLYHAEVMRAAC